MTYLLVKSLHIVAVVIWIGSLFLITLMTSLNGTSADQMKLARRVTEAGIGLTWLFGIVLVVLGSWYTFTWWQIKIVLVIVVSAIHSIMHRRWRRQAESGQQTNPALPWVLLGLTVLVVSLAVFKQP